jgi:hypothetical protein
MYSEGTTNTIKTSLGCKTYYYREICVPKLQFCEAGNGVYMKLTDSNSSIKLYASHDEKYIKCEPYLNSLCQ